MDAKEGLIRIRKTTLSFQTWMVRAVALSQNQALNIAAAAALKV